MIDQKLHHAGRDVFTAIPAVCGIGNEWHVRLRTLMVLSPSRKTGWSSTQRMQIDLPGTIASRYLSTIAKAVSLYGPQDLLRANPPPMSVSLDAHAD
jgi:hypothetical protein